MHSNFPFILFFIIILSFPSQHLTTISTNHLSFLLKQVFIKIKVLIFRFLIHNFLQDFQCQVVAFKVRNSIFYKILDLFAVILSIFYNFQLLLLIMISFHAPLGRSLLYLLRVCCAFIRYLVNFFLLARLFLSIIFRIFVNFRYILVVVFVVKM